MSDNLTIGSRIALERKKKGFSQQDVAGRLKVSRSLVAQIEKDLTKPNLEFLNGFVKMTNSSYTYLIDGVSEDELLKHEGNFDNIRIDLTSLFKERIKNIEFKQNEIFKMILEDIWELTDKKNALKIAASLRKGFVENSIISRLLIQEIINNEEVDVLVDKFLKYKKIAP